VFRHLTKKTLDNSPNLPYNGTMMNKERKLFKLELTEDQISYLKVALEKAMDNEADEEYSDAFAELLLTIRQTCPIMAPIL